MSHYTVNIFLICCVLYFILTLNIIVRIIVFRSLTQSQILYRTVCVAFNVNAFAISDIGLTHYLMMNINELA
jgi:hypothetical protein